MSHDTSLGLSPHRERDRAAAEEANGNGRTGVLVKLTAKQVSSVIALAVLIAGGAVKYFTAVPAKAEGEVQHSVPAETTSEPKAEALALQLKAHVDDVSGLREELRDTRAEVRDLRTDMREVGRALRALERQGGLRRDAVGEPGGSR